MSDTPKPSAADAYETMEALICEMQGLRDELADVKRERDEARMESMIFQKEMRRLLETLAAKRAAEIREAA